MSADDLIRIMCPKLGCQRVLAVPASARGLIVRCRGCRSKVRIPMARASREADSAGHAGAATSAPGASNLNSSSGATTPTEPSKRAAA